MRIYVATSIKNKKVYNLVCDTLIERGHKITFRWDKFADDPMSTYFVGELCKRGIRSSDIVVVIYPGSTGTAFECGYAEALGKSVYALVHDVRTVEWECGGANAFSSEYHTFIGLNELVKFLDEINEIEQ